MMTKPDQPRANTQDFPEDELALRRAMQRVEPSGEAISPARSAIQRSTTEQVLAIMQNHATGNRHSREFSRRVQSGEISPERFNLDRLDDLVGRTEPLGPDEKPPPICRADLGNQAIVLTRDEFLGLLGGLRIRNADGEIMELDPEDYPGDFLVIYPDELS